MDANDFRTELKQAAKALESLQYKNLTDAIEAALVELRLGNSGNGDWERARRAIHILENELDWHRREMIK